MGTFYRFSWGAPERLNGASLWAAWRPFARHMTKGCVLMAEITRRGFVAGGVAAGAVAAAGAWTAGVASADEAGATHSWETVPADIPADQIVATKEADVVVVGAGPSGFCTAVSAAENGLSVIMIEKDVSYNANGGAMFFVNSAYQKEIGYEIDKAEAGSLFLELMGKKVDQRAVWKFFDRSGEAGDWFAGIMSKYGMEPVMQGIGYPNDPNNCAIAGTLAFYGGPNTPTDVTDYDPYTCDLGLGYVPMVDYLEAMTDYAQTLGVQIDYNCASERILRGEDGVVSGIVASTEDGYVQYNAAKAMVLAAGDYGSDPEMMATYCSQVANFAENVFISTFNTGDTHKQAMWVGGVMQPWPAHAPSCFVGDAHPIWNLNVNEDCQRFANEYTSTSSLANAILREKNCKNIALFNEKYATQLPSIPGVIGREVPTPEQLVEAWDALVEAGVYVKAGTIEGIAEALGLDAERLVATVEHYNELCAAGEDADFHKPAELLFALDEPPYYGFRNGACMLSVHGGLHVNPDYQVLDAEEQPIEGLYAVGLTAGDFWANNYTTRFAGISHGRNVTSGYLVGRTIAGLE